MCPASHSAPSRPRRRRGAGTSSTLDAAYEAGWADGAVDTALTPAEIDQLLALLGDLDLHIAGGAA